MLDQRLRLIDYANQLKLTSLIYINFIYFYNYIIIIIWPLQYAPVIEKKINNRNNGHIGR